MKRWLWIPVMAPVMGGLLRLVIWADRLYAWEYNPEFAPPTATDFARAAIVFWVALLTPLLVGLVCAIVAFCKAYPPRWPILESAIVAFPYLIVGIAWLGVVLHWSRAVPALWSAILWAFVLVGGVVVISLLNMGACVRQRMWGKCVVVTAVVFAGMLYLFWLCSFIIYIDT